MIKVIASDIDGTLLNQEHHLCRENIEAIMRARESGISFLISTGRKYKDVIRVLESEKLADGYISLSGAQTVSGNGELLNAIPLAKETVGKVVEYASDYPVLVILNAMEEDYVIGTQTELEEILRSQENILNGGKSMEKNSDYSLIPMLKKRTIAVPSLEILHSKVNAIYKIFIAGEDLEALARLDHKIRQIPDAASASSFVTNLEITHAKAQKGPVLLDFIQKGGYRMDEVMVIGDSMNDYSMLSMDYGATVAMGNAMEELKEVAMYVTADCDHHGVADAINSLLDGNLESLRKK